MISNKQIIILVFAFLSVWLTYQVTITMAQPTPDTGANTSGINMTTSGSNMTSPNTGANTSGSGVNTTITKA